MATFNIIMPKLGESILEATITKWFVKPGDKVEEDAVLLEIATDKVDSEVPSPVDGVVKEIFFAVDAVVPVGAIIAVIDLDSDGSVEPVTEAPAVAATSETPARPVAVSDIEPLDESGKFYSPVVRKMASENGLSATDLAKIVGSGLNGRVTRKDVEDFIAKGSPAHTSASVAASTVQPKTEMPAPAETSPKSQSAAPVISSGSDQIIEMDRMRKLIAEHMVNSKKVAPHVTSVVEADVTALVKWRDKVKGDFQKKYGEKLTFMPVFAEAVAKALRDFPLVNSSVDGDKIYVHKNINVGIAVSLPSGNLIVPVIKGADQLNLAGMSSAINNLADKARANKLSPDDIQGGTFTITNFGSFKNIIGTPIINQPQVAILATGSIEKKVAVIETPEGDTIGIRQKMFLSLSYDHRIVDGMLGGNFLRRIADYLEQFDVTRSV